MWIELPGVAIAGQYLLAICGVELEVRSLCRHRAAEAVIRRLLVVIFKMATQRPRVAVTLVAAFELALERLFTPMGHHMAIAGK